MTLNDYCVKFYGKHFVELPEATRREAIRLHNNFGLSDPFADLFPSEKLF